MEYMITRMDGKIFSFLMDAKRAVEIHCDVQEQGPQIGSIYVGRIKNIAKNIGAAFVEIAPGEVCYLPLSEMKRPVYTRKGSSKLPQQGDELLVQISRGRIKSKAMSVTTNLTISGKYLLLTTGNCSVCASSKLSKAEKERLIGLVAPYADQERYGWLVRTNADGAGEETLAAEAHQLQSRYEALMEQAQYRTCYSCVLRRPDAWLTRLLGLYDRECTAVRTDDEMLYEQIRAYLAQEQPDDLKRLAFYQDDLLPMKKLYSLEQALSQALSQRVWLDCGGYLVIQPTEALTVIDVNSGKYEGGKKREAAFLKINLEAAAEISRQLRLRNISGIIIVDFINMEEPSSNELLLGTLADYLHRDPVRTVLVEMTKLSLVEITRRRGEPPLFEQINQQKNSEKSIQNS